MFGRISYDFNQCLLVGIIIDVRLTDCSGELPRVLILLILKIGHSKTSDCAVPNIRSTIIKFASCTRLRNKCDYWGQLAFDLIGEGNLMCEV